MAAKLKDGSIRLVMGNSDVPVGQYTQKILKFYHLDEQAIAQAGQVKGKKTPGPRSPTGWRLKSSGAFP